MAVWVVFGSSIAAVVYWTWWHQMGPLSSIICGTLLLALFGVIGCLDARRLESPSVQTLDGKTPNFS
jgi:prepilin signal peptidase PulO-like enzyme (type II secretory pathway)